MERLLSFLNGIPADKVAHFASGAVLFAVFALFTGWEWALVGVAMTATAKEVYDYLHRDIHTPDVLDAVATTLGGCLGAFIALTH